MLGAATTLQAADGPQATYSCGALVEIGVAHPHRLRPDWEDAPEAPAAFSSVVHVHRVDSAPGMRTKGAEVPG